MDEERDIIIRLKYEDDKASLDKAIDGTKKLEKGTKDVAKAAEEARKKYNQMREMAERARMVGMSMAAVGTAIIGPLMLASKAYLDNARALKDMAEKGMVLNEAQKKAVATAERWDAATQRLQQSVARVGGVVIEQILPWMEKAAALAEQAAAFAEAHPEAIKAALVIGSVLIAVGTLITVVSQAVAVYSSVMTLLSAGSSIATGLATLGPTLMAVAGTLAAALGPLLLLGAAIGILIALLQSKEGQEGIKAGKELVIMLVSGLASIFGGAERGKQVFLDLSYRWGLINEEAYKTGQIALQNTAALKQENQLKQQTAQVTVSIWSRVLDWFKSVLSWVNTALSKISSFKLPGQAEGGYATAGIYQMGERGYEFVLNHGTTTAAERMIGSPLTQENMLSMMRGSSRAVTINDHRRFDSSLSAQDRRAIRSDTREMMLEALT